MEMRTASPSASAPRERRPARASPITGSSPAAGDRTAKPSMAELSQGGTSSSLVTSSASTRPSESSSGTSSAARGRTSAATRLRASSIRMSPSSG